MSSDEHWNPFDGLPEETEERPSTAWIRQINELLSLVDSRWADIAAGKGKETPLHLAAASVALVRSALLRLKGIDANMEPIEELVIALSNAIDGKQDPLTRPLDAHREPGFRVRMLRGRAVLAVDLLMQDDVREDQALKLVSRQLALLGIPALAVKPGAIRDWRTNVKWNKSMPEERTHYDNAKTVLAATEQEFAQAGFEPSKLNRQQMFRALFARVADKERSFGV